MKKLMAALLAVAMVCAMAIPAFAGCGTEVSGSKVDITNHDFEAYQIFSAKLDTKGTLSDVQWGNGVKGLIPKPRVLAPLNFSMLAII